MGPCPSVVPCTYVFTSLDRKLKLFRKRKNQDAGGKAPKKSESTSSESSLLASSTYPAAIRHTVKGSLAVPGTASLTQSNIETGRSFEGMCV